MYFHKHSLLPWSADPVFQKESNHLLLPYLTKARQT
uniref:Uncharacterized protein n=1 Tax=Picea glauca TaxID=3330 RepID=A0A101LUS3_PICGL|nr:hypothetical protein ABT39_MTgene2297 [Picea glauca]